MDLPLEVDWVITVEPGFYVVPAILEDQALVTRFEDIVDFDRARSWYGFGGIRIEDDLRITELGPGDVVGEISLVLRRPANATVRALTPTVALFLGRDEFQDAIREHATLLGELYETATQRDEETRTVVAQEAMDVGDIVLL